MTASAEDRLTRIVKRLALVFALSVGLGLPGGYFGVRYSSKIEHVEVTAQIMAQGLNALAATNPELWVYQLQRMEEVLLRYPTQLVDDRAFVRDAAGNLLLTVGELPDAPVLVRASPIYDSGRVVGQVEIMHSYREVVFGTLVAGLLGLLLGVLVYATLLVLPLREIRRVASALAREHTTLRDIHERLAAEVTERQQAEQIAEKDRLLRLFYELPFVGLAVTSPSSKHWLQVNDYMCEMLGYPREELLKLAWTETTYPGDLPANLALFQRLTAGEFDAFQFDKRFLRKDGGIVDTTMECRCVRRGDGSLETVVIMVRNITEQKRAQEIQARLAAIVASSNDAIISRSLLDEKILSWNAGAERLFGYTADEAISQSVLMIVPPDREEEMARNYALLAQGIPIIDLETERLAKGGQRVAVSLSQSPIRDEHGLVAGVALVFHDIRERKQAEAALRDSEARYRSVIAAIAEGVVLGDKDSRVVACNASAERILGSTLDQMRGNAYFGPSQQAMREDGSIFPDEERPVHMALRTGRLQSNVVQGLRKSDGTVLWLLLNVQPLFAESETTPSGTVTTLTDITERKRVEEQLAALNAELEVKVASRTEELAIALEAATESDRLKSEFMANVTHELRTPLNSVIGFADLLRDEVPGPLNAKQAAFAADILAGGERLLALVEGILEMSRLNVGGAALEREPVEIGAALEERVAARRKAAEARGLTLRLDVAADAGSTELDPRALRSMLDALLDNAIKFNREGGTVAVSARCANNALEIAVADTGIGIAQENMEKIFKPLTQLDAGRTRRHGGLGLGLTLARRLAELHGGTIEVASEAGKGSTFTLRLPLQVKS